jgi:hypothetical protein
MIVETGQLELAAATSPPDFVNHCAATTENASLWLRTAFSHRRHWQRDDDRWISEPPT